MALRSDDVLAGLDLGLTRVDDLSAHLGVSPSTVRRALTRLERSGAIVRTYGGAVRSPSSTPTWEEKELVHAAAKRAIAAEALRRLPQTGVICLGAGTTTHLLASGLADRWGLTVVTNGAGTAQALREAPGLEVVVLGGRLDHRTGATAGPLAEEMLERVSIDTAVVGVDGLVPGRGISCPTAEMAALKRRKIHAARELLLLADASKLGAAPYPWWAPLHRPYTVVTDAAITPAQRADLAADPLATVVVAEPAGSDGDGTVDQED